MLKKLGIVLGVLVALIFVFAVVVALQPAAFRIERSATIDAPPATVFGLVNDFHAWERWSPWAKLDPEMTTTYEGSDAGAGAVYSWKGNSQVGEGRMTITESIPNERVQIELAFLKPMAATNTAIFALAPEGDGTAITWSMEGSNNFMGKAFNLLMNMDELVGADFEKGLADMKAAAEADVTKAGA